uniref:YggS family pyridoxal phosphate-dependent enzyme n=1 Tax=Alloprevotella sp. TaxID=1872471 RepID=UPI003FF089FB
MIHLKEIKATIRPGVELVAVSKFHPASLIQEAYDEGQRIFGESRAQELQAKHETLPKDIAWHFIGHLQPNKVKNIAPYISLIHAVDSMKLLREIDKQAAKHDRVIDCLLELHLAQEATKYGLSLDDCRTLLQDGEWRELHHVRIVGLMCMASNTDDEAQVRSEFHQAYSFFKECKEAYFANDDSFCQRSWGMSHDYQIAMQEGATLVRVGTAIFGEREY